MARMSQTVKEIIQIVVFLVVVGVLLVVFLIYPLGQARGMMGRADIYTYHIDSLPPNDPTVYIEAGLPADTFTVDTDGLTTLACLYIHPAAEVTGDSTDEVLGTVLLLHGDDEDRSSWLGQVRALTERGLAVVVYDQRGVGLSSGDYRGEGQYEATDLYEVISYLDIRGLLHSNLTIVGKNLGADAALLAALDEPRITRVMAIEPYLTTDRWLEQLREKHDPYWIPFPNTLYWFWYELRSDYSTDYREIEHIQAIACPTLLAVSPETKATEAIQQLIDLSDPALLTKVALDGSAEGLTDAISTFLQ